MSSGTSNKPENDFQKGMIYSLEKKGVLENLKAYLRTDIYNKLKKNDDEESKQSKINYNNFLSSGTISNNLNLRNSSIGDFEKNKLIRLSLSLISDFLKKHSLNYSHSVFVSEYKKLVTDDFWTESEISKICDLDYSSLEKSGETSFLSYIIKTNFFSQNFKNKELKSTETQTEFENTGTYKNIPIISIEEKLKEIDSKYSKSINFESLMPAKSIEEKMLKYQREQEARFQSDLEREIQRVKECELSLMRIEENKKYMKKIEDIREEYEREYREKFDFLKKKENDLNIRINLKEKEIETHLYESRQKFLSELQTLKIKEDEMRIKFENEFSNSKLEEEKLKFKQKELDHLKESSLRKIKEEIEQFKLEYDRKFEIEKNEVRKMKLESEEREIKNNLYLEKMKSLEESIKFMTNEKEKLLRDLNSLERDFTSYRKDNEMLRNELKILSDSEKRNSEMLSRKETETSHYKEENKILRESLEEHKKLSEERRRDQNILLENLKKQLEENLTRSEKSKDYYESEINKVKKNNSKELEREKEVHEEKIKELEKKIKILETNVGHLGQLENEKNMPASKHEFNNRRMQQNGPTAQQGQVYWQGNTNFNSNRIGNNYNNTVTSSMNLNRGQTGSLHSAQSGNFLYTMNEIKASDRMMTLSKLEKEADELKNELKRNMISSRRENKENNMEKVYFELYEKLNREKILQINSNTISSQGLNYNQIPYDKNNSNYNNYPSNPNYPNYPPSMNSQEYDIRNNIHSNPQIQNEEKLNARQIINNLKTISSVPEAKDDAISTIPQDSLNKKIKEKENIYEVHNKDTQLNILKQNNNIESVRSDENILNGINNIETKRDNYRELKFSPKTEKNPHRNIPDENLSKKSEKSEKQDDNSGKKEKEKTQNIQIISNITHEEKLQLESELNKMKDDYNKKLQHYGSDKNESEKSDQDFVSKNHVQHNTLQTGNDQRNQFNQINKLPTPTIIGGHNLIRTKELERQDSANINDFSVANLTSSNEWELESLRKDKDPNLFKNVSNIQHNQSQQSMSLQVKEIIPLTNLTEMKKDDPLEKFDKFEIFEKSKDPEIIETHFETNIQKEIIIVPNIITQIQTEKKDSTLSPRKLEVIPDPSQSVKLKALPLNNNNTNNSIKEESEESYNISNLIDNTKDKKSSIPSDSDIYKTSFNKFSNVNYEMDKNEIEEDIKVDGESENYDYDFVEDVDGLDKKMSVDLDAIKNASINFNNSVNNYQQAQKNANAGNNSNNLTYVNSPQSPHLNHTYNKSVYKSQSIDKQIEKLLQSKASGIEENIVEDISIETSKRENIHSGKSNTIEEDSNLKYNDYYQSANMNLAASSSYNNIIKNVVKPDSSIKDSQRLYESRTSDIKEDIFQEYDEDGFEPVNHTQEDY